MKVADERLALLEGMMSEAAADGLILRTADDMPLDGRTVSFEGASLLNFGSCSYLGLELDPRMRAGVVDAVMRYGTQFSSSRTYVQAPPYLELEAMLGRLFGGRVLVTPTTTLGHVTALPVLVAADDLVVIDQMVHHSVQMAVNHVRVQGTAVEMIRHSDIAGLQAVLARADPRQRVWYLADGVYSMFADHAPFEELAALMELDERLHLYIDDSHGVSWAGAHGRGPALEALGSHERLVIAASLNKSFAAAGAAMVFHDPEFERRVRMLGGPMIFSGPVQPPMLGAALASARIHLSDELPEMQAALRERIRQCSGLLREHCLPLATEDVSPIRFIPVGLPERARTLARRLLADGLYVNVATFPAVPMKQAGVRVTLTLHHQPEDITRLVETLARHLPDLIRDGEPRSAAAAPASATPTPSARLGRAVAGPRPDASGSLRLEHHTSIDALPGAEWDRLLGDRGTFSVDGLRFLERAFAGGERPEDRWSFRYYVVRDRRGRPVLATWFTDALWKDDMLAPASVSALVEERRREDPYYLTSRTFAMGSLLTEGDHLYLDRARHWRGALGLLTEAIGEHAGRSGATTMVIRDVDAGDLELAGVLRSHGFVPLSMPDSYVIEPLPADDDAWLASLSQRSRAHQRREVLAREEWFEVDTLRRGGRVPGDRELEALMGLYGNVRERSLEINSFALPATLLRDMLDHDCWELMVLRLRAAHGGDGGDGAPVAFGAHFVGPGHYAPMIVGLDYRFVTSHGAYRQALRQAMVRARAHGAGRVLLGMGAGLEKHRIGATPHRRVAFAQSSDHYSAEALAGLEAAAFGSRRARTAKRVSAGA